MRYALILICAALAACSTPRDACLRTANAELRAIDAQISESEAALARGFRTSPVQEPRTTVSLCAWPREPVLFCTSHSPGQRATRQRVHPPAEEARLAELRRERARLAVIAADRIAACPV
ncbi:MAG: hypothetical protein ACXIU7_10715 [Roseinatronobacter sp.]